MTDDEKFYTVSTIEIGRMLAENAKKGAALGVDCGKMCNDCAFKFNQPHTGDYLDAVNSAANMLSFEGKFHCHTDDNQCSDKPCSGFLYAKAYFDSIE